MSGALTVANLLVNVGADLGDLNKGFGQVEGTVDRFVGRVGGASAALGKFFVGASLAGIAAVGAGFTTATTAAMDFEKTLSGVRAVSGATAGQMKQLSDLALKLGADTSFSATEAAQGIEELVKAGVSMADVMGGAAKASLDLAAAGGISVADAATIASNAMNQFGIKGKDMAGVADLIAGAANASAIDVGQFKFSLQSVGAVAATVGLSFKDTATAIAVLGQAGITGSDAGTSLKTMLMGLQPQTKEQTKLFRDLGLMTKDGANKFFDASGKVKGMADVAQILQNALKGQTEQQKLATLQTLFGSDAIRAAAVLARNGAEGFRDMAKAMGEVSAADVAETRLDNLSGSLEKLKGSLSTVAITVGQQLTPGLRTLVDWATSTVNYWAPTISMFAARVPAAIDRTIRTIRTEFVPIAQAAWSWLSAKWGDALTWLTRTGWPLLTGAVAAATAYIDGVFMPIVQESWAWLAPKMQGALTWLAEDGWPMVTAAIGAFSSWLQGTGIPTLRGLWDWLSSRIGGALTWLRETAWPRLREAASSVIEWLSTTAVGTLRTVWDWLSPKLAAAFTWLTQTGWPLLKAAGVAFWTWTTESLFPALGQWWAWLEQKLQPAYSWLIDYGWPMLQSAGTAVWTWLTESLFPALSEWWTWFQDRLSPIYSWFIDYAWPALQTAGAAFWSWLTESLVPKLTEWWWWLEEKLQPAANWFIDKGFPSLKEGAKTLTGIIDGLSEAWRSFTGDLAKTDTAESWVTILENLGKFGHYLLTKIDLGGWFSSVGSGASAANGEIGYMAQAIAWISRTLAKWSKWLPGVDVPDIADPPARPGGGSGGGGRGGSTIDAPPQRSTGGGSSGGGSGGGGLFPSNPYPGGGSSGGGSGSGSGGGSGSSGGGSGGGGGTPREAERSPIDNSSRSAFVRSAASYMLDAAGGNRDLASMMLATAISENGSVGKGGEFWANNFFGIKGEGPAGSVNARTWEDDNGNGRPDPSEYRDQKFAAFSDPVEGMGGFLWFLRTNSRYRGALATFAQTGDAIRLFQDINAAGYATDRTWWSKVVSIRDSQVKPVIGYAKGGWAGLNGPELAVLGERGPEYVVPNGMLGQMGGDTYYVTVQVNGNALASKEDIATAVVIGLQHAQRTGRTKVAVI